MKNDHPVTVSLINNATPIWKRMWNIRIDAETKMRWLISKGEVDISLDRWSDAIMNCEAFGPIHSLFLSNNELEDFM